jgi:hypothetical protein
MEIRLKAGFVLRDGHSKSRLKMPVLVTCPPKTGPDFVIVFWDNLGRE